ncbi:Predicted arabinose efflux permease, MFS family [Draconibacterium orientale]|uniref:Major facilitator transporter n=1 Tax=Draconibacterium orientale TaxID=1168034 RepID=X5DZ12_9BACT|nr:MFS transporter [Draconibacterium orientale]AHW59551.1 major facilitator transporter [Draconibacterium orientale]SES92132.1 Predicted arabinose efflux permease, MFS family [Draconibacterium orientale]
MKNTEIKKYYTLLSLYLAQSIPMSFFSTVIPVIMRMENYSLESIGYIQLIKLPWILKMLWAPLVDKTSKNKRHYRRWIIMSEAFYALIIMSIGYLNLQTDFTTIIILMVIAFTASATQDIATDAFAILILNKNERSLGNSMQSAGSFIGTMMGSGVLLIIYHYFGWLWLLRSLGLFVLFALIPVSLYNARNGKEPDRSTKNVSPLEFIYFFRQKKIGAHLLLLFLFYSGIIGILTMIKPYFVDLGYDIKEIGIISGIFGTACGVIMTVPAGFLLRKKGITKAVWIFPVINVLVATFFFGLTYTNHALWLVYLGVSLLWGAYAMSSVFVYTMSMHVVRKGREGTDFTIQIVITHLSGLIIAIMSGKVADALTYRGLFAIEIGLGILILALLPFIFRKSFYLKYEQETN